MNKERIIKNLENNKNTELIKEKSKIWINKVLNCKNLKELLVVLDKFRKSKYYKHEYEDILIYYLIKNNPQKAFKILMDSVNNYEHIISTKQMCLYFSTKDVLNSIDYNKNKKSQSARNFRLNSLKKFVNEIDNNYYQKSTECKFDVKTNYFVIESSYKVTNYFGRSRYNHNK